MSDELLEKILEELPDAFSRLRGTAVDKVREYVSFSSKQTAELMEAYAVLPDSLNRPLPERVQLLLDRANREAALAVKLRHTLDQIANPDQKLLNTSAHALQEMARIGLGE